MESNDVGRGSPKSLTVTCVESYHITECHAVIIIIFTVYEKEPYEKNICFFKKYILFQKTYILFQKTYIFFKKHTYFFKKHIYFFLKHIYFFKKHMFC